MRFTEQPVASQESPAAETPASIDPPRVSVAMYNTLGELVDGIAGIERMQASLAAAKAELVEQARQWSEITELSMTLEADSGWSARNVAHRVLVTELACALRIPERTAEALIADSRALTQELPATLAALSEGSISWRYARAIVDHASSLPEDARAAFETAVLPSAKTLTVAKFDRKARVERERRHPESIDDRHQKVVDDRSVDVQPASDGMAWLGAYLPATDAQGIYNRITDMAISQQGPEEARTLTQLRADLFTELLLDGRLHADRRGSGIRPRVLITVPVLALLGLSEEPATLEGYGPIDIETARELTAMAPSLTRILTHPETGAVLSVGRDRYAVPADLRIWLRVRDGTCRFPGCNRGARRCDIDHTVDRQFGGPTNHDNLAHLCPAHHHLKHMTGWRVKQLGVGRLEWMSPSGHSYTTEPATQLESAPDG